MPYSDPIQRFEDILENAERIQQYTVGASLNDFRAGGIASDAVERCLERICEASKELGSLAEELCPDVPWSRLRALGNFLVH